MKLGQGTQWDLETIWPDLKQTVAIPVLAESVSDGRMNRRRIPSWLPSSSPHCVGAASISLMPTGICRFSRSRRGDADGFATLARGVVRLARRRHHRCDRRCRGEARRRAIRLRGPISRASSTPSCNSNRRSWLSTSCWSIGSAAIGDTRWREPGDRSVVLAQPRVSDRKRSRGSQQ